MSVVESLAHWLHPWESAFSHSKVVSSAVLAVHLTALLFAGGLAVAADRMTLRSVRGELAERLRQLDEVHAVHRPVMIAMGFLFASGVALAAADVKTFASSPVFVVKLSLVTLLTLNGLALTLNERRLRRDAATGASVSGSPRWSRVTALAWVSLALWTATLCTGVVLANTA
jgi:hypothetical protein